MFNSSFLAIAGEIAVTSTMWGLAATIAVGLFTVRDDGEGLRGVLGGWAFLATVVGGTVTLWVAAYLAVRAVTGLGIGPSALATFGVGVGLLLIAAPFVYRAIKRTPVSEPTANPFVTSSS